MAQTGTRTGSIYTPAGIQNEAKPDRASLELHPPIREKYGTGSCWHLDLYACVHQFFPIEPLLAAGINMSELVFSIRIEPVKLESANGERTFFSAEGEHGAKVEVLAVELVRAPDVGFDAVGRERIEIAVEEGAEQLELFDSLAELADVEGDARVVPANAQAAGQSASERVRVGGVDPERSARKVLVDGDGLTLDALRLEAII